MAFLLLGLGGGIGNKNTNEVSVSNTSNTLNRSQINNINDNMVSTAVNTMIKNASTCSQSTVQQNACSVKGVKTTGGFKFNGGKQSNAGNVTLSCLQGSKVESAMAAEMLNKAQAMLQQAAKDGVKVELAAAATLDKQDKGILTMGGIGNTNTNRSTTNNTVNITNDMVQNIVNKTKQELSSNFNATTVNECLSNVLQTNNISLADIEAGKDGVDINCGFQENVLNLMTECKQLNEAVQNTTNAVFSEYKLAGTTSTVTNQEITAKAEGKLSQISTGLFGGPNSEIASFFVICSCCICVACIIYSQVGGGMTGGGNNYKKKDIITDSTVNLISLISSESEYL